jgi:urate oxidase
MTLVHNTHGKGRVRVMRVNKVGDHHEVRELTVHAMLKGDFARAFTHADNARVISTDTVKNVVNIVARENMALANEPFCQVLATRFLDSYEQIDEISLTAHETRWSRLPVNGAPHPHSFTLDGNGRPFATVVARRSGMETASGISGFTFMKCTQSGWSNFLKDPYTTLQETDDRIAATSMEATWRWQSAPADYEAANATLLARMLDVFATTYSHSVQDSLYRMGEAALAAVPELLDISMACPNKHYLLLNLAPFGLDNENQVFVATDEPHGQIECTVGRG